MRDLDLEAASDLVICPYRALLHLPTWSDRRRVFERVARALRPGGRFAWNAFVFDHRYAAEFDGSGTTSRCGTTRVRSRRQPHRHHAGKRPHSFSLVDLPKRVGGVARRVGPRDRSALRLVRPAAVRRLEPRVRLGRPEAGVTLYDRIAGIYDPWSRSVTEDVGFYVDQSLASGGPVVELAVGTGRIAIPIAQAGIEVIGVDASPGMLAVAQAAAEEAGVADRIDLRLGDLREPPVSERVPLVICPFRSLLHMETEEEKLRALDGSSKPSGRRGPFRLRCLRAEPRRHRGDGRPLARARARDLRARRLGRGLAHALAVGPLGRGRDDIRPPLALCTRMAETSRRGGVRGRRALRLVRSAAPGRRGGHGLRLSPRHHDRVHAVIWVLVILGLIVVVALLLVALYNRLVRLRNRVDNAWAQVEVQLKRRWDLIPNLVETVKGYAAHERETFEAVTNARTARAQQAGTRPRQRRRRASSAQALGRLFAVAEAYPELQARRELPAVAGTSSARRRTRSPSAARSTTTRS